MIKVKTLYFYKHIKISQYKMQYFSFVATDLKAEGIALGWWRRAHPSEFPYDSTAQDSLLTSIYSAQKTRTVNIIKQKIQDEYEYIYIWLGSK